MEPLADQMHAAIPQLSPIGREIISLLVRCGGSINCPDSFAADLHHRLRCSV